MNRFRHVILLALACLPLATLSLMAGPPPGQHPDLAADSIEAQGTFFEGPSPVGTWEELNVGVNGFPFEFRIWTADAVYFFQPVDEVTRDGKKVFIMKWEKLSIDGADPYNTDLWQTQLGGTAHLDVDGPDGDWGVEDIYQNGHVTQHIANPSFNPIRLGD
jgi:hypothetical protein